ncbi:rhomboid family intramembrane serine protease [Bacillus sp. B15-48]|uniref:rhomboid family protein n=1 Tax=Bacillus sp. B15-48 TaxID=1548601 RepID=UPI001EF3BAF9|nr:rhomboid family intramembrane serine protease [Bacillus sp. B15-48]
MKEEYLFWRTAYFLIVKREYRIIQLSKDQRELWLENMENKEAQIVRLFFHQLDWTNWLLRDIEVVAKNVEQIRRENIKGNLSVLNLYFSAYPPVDDYEQWVADPYIEPLKEKIKVTSKIIESVNSGESLRRIENLFGERFEVDEEWPHENKTDEYRRKALITANEREKAEKQIFHAAKPFFSYIFLTVQVIIFFLMEMKGSSTDTTTLIEFGAKFNPLILEGEWWRFFTPIFIHIGFLHLLMNSLALYYLGPLVERIFGNHRFLFIYLLAGFGGSLASFIFSVNLSAGASGAIFGLFGALLYFGVVFPQLFFRSMGMNILIVLAINLVFGFTVPGIDNAGHIGGLIAGFAAAGIVHFPKRKRVIRQGSYLVATAVIIIGLIQFGFNHSEAVVNEQSILILAQKYIQDEEYDDAYRVLTHYKNNESPEILFMLSFTEIKRDQLDRAKTNLYHVIQLKPDFHEAYYNLALVYLEQEDFVKANEYAKKALQLEPGNQAYNELLDNITAYLERIGL